MGIDWGLWSFVSAVAVSTYVITEKKWATVLAGAAGYATHKALFGRQQSTDVADKKSDSVQQPVPEPEPKEPEPTDPIRRKVVAFDFDKCLMTRHWWGTFRNSPIENINPGPSDFAHPAIGSVLQDLFEQSDSKKNNLTCFVAVASFGRNDVITKAIHSILEPKYANRVFVTTPGDYEPYTDGTSMGNKNVQLRAISEKFDTELKDIIFFDDDKNNIFKAREIGVNAIVAAPFNRELEPKIYEHISE